MGMFGEGREQYENVEGKNCVPNQCASIDSPGCHQTLPFTDFLEEQRERVPSVEKPLKAEIHEEEAIREENHTIDIGPVDPRAEENPADDTLGDENQPDNTIFLSPLRMRPT